MKTVKIQAAKTHLSRLVEEAVAGQDIVLAKGGKPMVRLTPVYPSKARKLGLFKGRVTEHAGCWAPDPSMEHDFGEAPVILPRSTTTLKR
jgi:prevent-host-death family protein